MAKQEFNVEMTCGGCSKAVDAVLKKTPGVDSVSIDLPAKKVTVEGSATKEEILAAIAKTGPIDKSNSVDAINYIKTELVSEIKSKLLIGEWSGDNNFGDNNVLDFVDTQSAVFAAADAYTFWSWQGSVAHNMSKVDTTPAALISDARALPKSGREEGVGIQGNTVFFSRTPEDELREADGLVYLVKCISPVGVDFDVPPHWHPNQTEFFRVFCGQVNITVDGVVTTLTPEDGELTIPAGAVHSIHIDAEVHAEFGERTDVDPIKKMLFLRGLIRKGGQAESLSMMQALRLFYEDEDTYPSTGSKTMDRLMVNVVGGFLGTYLGYGRIPESTEEEKQPPLNLEHHMIVYCVMR
ncbi:hypothetical protein PROFUN_05918 [Planoprotostelium fungivorum]|uniref:HMA domain-containing protein n=1 Tax=Planoprotostelium fungivorum TaxID=1890364 RepID=A0A2P6N7L2_9EUKA|nr:hypothetical protein PROFUN_05918 [Planoprotostelium fungivorum]